MQHKILISERCSEALKIDFTSATILQKFGIWMQQTRRRTEIWGLSTAQHPGNRPYIGFDVLGFGFMSHDSLLIQLPEIIGIPVVALFIITFIKAATSAKKFQNDQAVDVAMDLAILATGASGGIFANDTLNQKWGIGVTVYGILTVLICICFVATLAFIRRWQVSPVANVKAWGNLVLGLIPLGMVTAILILGYTITIGR
jgi:hypothetical protein